MSTDRGIHSSMLLKSIRGAVIVTPWVLQLFLADILLSLLLPVSFIAPTLAYNVSSIIAWSVWRVIQLIFTRFNKAQITISGDTLPYQESAMVIANHVAWSDFYLIQQVAINAGMLGRCRYFAKQQLKWVPFLGWGLWAMGMPLISRRWDKDSRELSRVFRGPKLYKWPMWLVSYSEATRYTAQKYLETVQWCKANGKPTPKYALYPRTKGFVTTARELGQNSSIRAIYDLTIAYAHEGHFFEVPAMWDTLSQPNLDHGWRFHVHVERFEISELASKSDTELAKWLEDRWMVKSQRLEQLKKDLDQGKPWSSSSLADKKKDA